MSVKKTSYIRITDNLFAQSFDSFLSFANKYELMICALQYCKNETIEFKTYDMYYRTSSIFFLLTHT